MSADVENSSATTRTTPRTTPWSWSSSSAELPTSTTPMSSSPTTASTPLLPSLSLLSVPPLLSSSPSSSAPPTTMTTTTTSVPPTTIPTNGSSTTTTTISITITPTSTIMTTTSISIPTSTPTVPPISPTSTSASTPTSSVTSWLRSSTISARSTTPSTSTTPIPPAPFTSSSPSPTPELMLTRTFGPVSTFSTTVYISTTDSRGSSMFYAPSFITSTTTLMDSGGTPTTSTALIANPTLNTDTSSPSSFFQNKGAVAGVFTLVGIAVISIIIWIILFIRRRRREIGLEHESTISALLYEAGVDRRSIDPASSASSHHSRYGSADFLAIPMPNPHPERYMRPNSGLLERRMSILPDAYHDDRGQYDPYIQYAPRNSRDGYLDMPSPTTPHLNVPPPSAYAPYKDRTSSDGMVEVGPGLPMGAAIVHARHSHHSSGSSFEPLLASHQWRNGPRSPIVLDATNLSNGRASRTPSTDNTSSASTSKPSYLPSLTHPNFYATNISSRSGLLINSREDQGSEVNLVDANGEIKKPNILAESEVSTTDDEHEVEFQKPVLAVRNLPDAASTLSLS